MVAEKLNEHSPEHIADLVDERIRSAVRYLGRVTDSYPEIFESVLPNTFFIFEQEKGKIKRNQPYEPN